MKFSREKFERSMKEVSDEEHRESVAFEEEVLLLLVEEKNLYC